MTSKKVLHILSGFHAAGIENLALQLIRSTPNHFASYLLNIDPSSTNLLPTFQQLISAGNLQAIYQTKNRGITLFVRLLLLPKFHTFDSVVIYPCNLSLLWLIAAFRLNGPKLIAICLQNTAPHSSIKRFKWFCLLRILLFLRVHLVCCSDAVADSIKGLLPVNYSCKVIPNGCATDLIAARSLNTLPLTQKSNAFKVMMVARLDQIKDQATLIKAFANASNRDWELYLVGDGPTRSSLERLVYSYDLASSVTFLGNRLDVPELLGSVDCFAFSTTASEGFGIVLIEAMAAGLPVIASDVPACREVLDHGNAGLLVPCGDIQSWCDALFRVFSDESFRTSLSQASSKRAKDYDIQISADAWFTLLDQ